MKSAVFERQQGQLDAALDILATALTKFPKFGKLYMIQGQIHQSRKNYPAARASFSAGTRACPKEIVLWILASRLEEEDGKSIKARALLEKARQLNPGNDELWAEAVGVEERSGGAVQAKAMLARGLQECPTSGLLWALSIWSEPRPTRKTRATDALKKTKDSPIIISTVARLFWADRKIEKARQWFERSVASVYADIGDHWGWWLKFERQHGMEEHREEVRNRCAAAEPHHGPVWQSTAKDVKNTGKSTKEILELVADALKQ
jgi:pre-mRNA-processing factor 6